MSEYIKSMGRHLTDEEIKNVLAKYNVGDMVVYIDNDNIERVGAIKEVEWTDINEWNSKLNPLYLIDGCQYLRKQSDIKRICVEIAPKYAEKDKVYYIDFDGTEKTGTIQKVYKNDVSEWNNIIKPLYLICGCLYYREEKDIFGFYIEEESEDCIENYIGI